MLDPVRESKLPGYAIGGLSGGEEKSVFWRIIAQCAKRLPENKPRYSMGIGYGEDLLVCAALGVDMADCVFPTRTAVSSSYYIPRSRNSQLTSDLASFHSSAVWSRSNVYGSPQPASKLDGFGFQRDRFDLPLCDVPRRERSLESESMEHGRERDSGCKCSHNSQSNLSGSSFHEKPFLPFALSKLTDDHWMVAVEIDGRSEDRCSGGSIPSISDRLLRRIFRRKGQISVSKLFVYSHDVGPDQAEYCFRCREWAVEALQSVGVDLLAGVPTRLQSRA